MTSVADQDIGVLASAVEAANSGQVTVPTTTTVFNATTTGTMTPTIKIARQGTFCDIVFALTAQGVLYTNNVAGQPITVNYVLDMSGVPNGNQFLPFHTASQETVSYRFNGSGNNVNYCDVKILANNITVIFPEATTVGSTATFAFDHFGYSIAE